LAFQHFPQSSFSDSLDVLLAEKPDSLQQKILLPLFLQYSNTRFQVKQMRCDDDLIDSYPEKTATIPDCIDASYK
jgi:hypothetical protein